MSGSRFIEHGNKQILLQDFSNLTDVDEGLRVVAAARGFVAALAARPGPPPQLLVLTTVANSPFNPGLVEALKEIAVHHKPYVRASAIVGLTAVTRLMHRIVTMFSGRVIRAFETREQALDWLVQQ